MRKYTLYSNTGGKYEKTFPSIDDFYYCNIYYWL